jgi:membrane fusion protein, copper/silver efflux system
MSESHDTYDPYQHEPLPEGEEAPPPYVHTMAIVRWLILGAISLFALFMVLSYFGATPWSATQASAIQYHCPMHPTYVSNQPGECPICGMTLVPIGEDGEGAKVSDTAATTAGPVDNLPKAKPGQYTCPMDPEVITDGPGECPKCGMDLEKVPEPGANLGKSSAGVAEAKPGQYACPMDPEVIADKPADCPKCGMALVLVSEPVSSSGKPIDMSAMKGMKDNQAKPAAADMSSMGTVPGLVTVTIEPQRLQLINLRTGKVERRSLDSQVRLAGYVTSDETLMTDAHVRISGWVRSLFVDQTGQYVKKGQPLLTIYSPELAQAQQDLIVARKATHKTIADNEVIFMRQQVLKASRERLQLLGVSEQDVRAIENSDSVGSDLTLRSPASGYILAKSVQPGQYIGADQNLYTIADLSTVWVLADVYEQDLSKVAVGQSADVTLAALPSETVIGKIGFIYPSVSEKSRTLKVRVEIANPDMRLRPGMYADVRLNEGGAAVLALPTAAVLDGGETKYAFVVHNGKHFEPRLLKLGKSDGDWVEVLSGVSEGDEVVTSANFLIDSESRLKAAVSGMASMPGMPGMPADDKSGQNK